jgi:hypothetical protein
LASRAANATTRRTHSPRESTGKSTRVRLRLRPKGTPRGQAFRIFQHEFYADALRREGVAHVLLERALYRRLALAVASVKEMLAA